MWWRIVEWLSKVLIYFQNFPWKLRMNSQVNSSLFLCNVVCDLIRSVSDRLIRFICMWCVSGYSFLLSRDVKLRNNGNIVMSFEVGCTVTAQIIGVEISHYQMPLVSPLLFLHRETRQNRRNNWMLINSYIPVISYTKLNFVSYVGLSSPNFLIFILYQLLSSNFRCILSVIPKSWLSAQSLSI
jgi:hypothetical protein